MSTPNLSAPWTSEERGDHQRIVIVDAQGHEVAEVRSDAAEAVTALPELIDSSEDALSCLESDVGMFCPWCDAEGSFDEGPSGAAVNIQPVAHGDDCVILKLRAALAKAGRQ